MIITTKRSRAIGFLLYVRKTWCRNIGVIGDRCYSYTKAGAFSWLLRRDWRSDFHSPVIPCTKTKISTKMLVDLLDDKYFQQ